MNDTKTLAATPMTDAAAAITAGGKTVGFDRRVDIEVARRLERDRAALISALEAALPMINEYRVGADEFLATARATLAQVNAA